MKYIRNYNRFSQAKRLLEKNTINEEFGAVFRDAQQSIEFVEQGVETIEQGISWSDIAEYTLIGLGIAGGAYLGGKAIASALKEDENKKRKWRILFGSTSPTKCPNAELLKFGLKYGSESTYDRYYTATVGDLIEAVNRGKGSDKLILSAFVRCDQPSDTGSNFQKNQKSIADNTDYFSINGKKLTGKIAFDLHNYEQTIVASGNGLLAITRMVRSAWDKEEPGAVYDCGVIQENATREITQITVEFSHENLYNNLKVLDEWLDHGCWTPETWVSHTLGKFTTVDQNGRRMVIGDKYYFTHNGKSDGGTLLDYRVESKGDTKVQKNNDIQHKHFMLQFTLAKGKSGRKLQTMKLGDREVCTQAVLSNFAQLHKEMIPRELYDSDDTKWLAAYEKLANDLKWDILTKEEVNGYMDRVAGIIESTRKPAQNGPLNQRANYGKGMVTVWEREPDMVADIVMVEAEIAKINAEIVKKYEGNFKKLAEYLVDSKTAKEIVGELNKCLSKDPAGVAANRYSSASGKGKFEGKIEPIDPKASVEKTQRFVPEGQ